MGSEIQRLKFLQKICKLAIFCKCSMQHICNLEFEAVQPCVDIVDLVKSFPTSVYLQKSASIQQRTSLSKFGGNLESGGVKKAKSNSLELEFEMRGQATLLLQIDQEVRDAGKLNPGHTGRWFRVMLKLSVISWHEIFFQHH